MGRDKAKLRWLQNVSQINVKLIDEAEIRNECSNLVRKPHGNISRIRLKHRRVGIRKVRSDVEEWI
jgi:hypothetical protein